MTAILPAILAILLPPRAMAAISFVAGAVCRNDLGRW
jgi:hypothetical protein